jgi:Flp pilus assembly protein TadD/DNA-binding Lrp family transcriptional regulator
MPDPSNTPLNATVKYNPHLWSDAELRSIFVVRTRELAELLQAVREVAPHKPPRHLLIVGHRGMGKSTLLRRLALAIADEAALNQQWIALSFPEEQYTVSTLAELWKNVLDALADTRQREGAPLAELHRLDTEISRIGNLPESEQETASLDLLVQWVRENGRRLILLMDSTDLIFSGLSDSGKKASNPPPALARLRDTLSRETGIFWLGASYQPMEALYQYDGAFQDFFQTLELHALSVEDMRQALLALARAFGADQHGRNTEERMLRTLDARPERLQVLHTLTGGNPRTTVMLYELFASSTQEDIHTDLKVLLDLMTPLYKARMEGLADQPRKLLAHLMENWEPMSMLALSTASGIPATTVSGQLNRLEAEGLISKTRLPGARRSGYQTPERFFNVWYLMRYTSRRVRQRLTWLVEFMRLWYSGDELRHLAQRRAADHASGRICEAGSLEYSLAIAGSLSRNDSERHLLELSMVAAAARLAPSSHQTLRQVVGELFDLGGEDRPLATAADYLERFRAVEARLATPRPGSGPAWQEMGKTILGSLFLTLGTKEKIADLAQNLSSAQLANLNPALEEEVSSLTRQYGHEAWSTLRAAVLAGDFFPDCPEPELAYRQIVAHFSHQPAAMRLGAMLMLDRHADAWSEKVLRAALTADPDNAELWNTLGKLLHYHRHNYGEAEQAYRKAMQLAPGFAYPNFNLGNLLKNHLQRYEEAEAAYRRAIELDPQFAPPWNNLGILLQDHLQRYEEAADAYRHASELDPKLAHPWSNLGNLLQDHLHNYAEAEAAYRRAHQLDPHYALSWNNLGNLLQDHLQRYEEAEAAYRKAIEFDPGYSPPWSNLGNLLLNHLERPDEAEAAYRKAIELDPRSATAWSNLGNLLQDGFRRYDEALSAHRQAAQLSPEDPYPPFREARLALRLGQTHAAETAYRHALELMELQNQQGERRRPWEIALQAGLWLQDQEIASQALTALAGAAGEGREAALLQLREQARQCHEIGVGAALAYLIDQSLYADFLRPMSLALHAAAGAVEALEGIAPELRSMAQRVMRDLGEAA